MYHACKSQLHRSAARPPPRLDQQAHARTSARWMTLQVWWIEPYSTILRTKSRTRKSPLKWAWSLILKNHIWRRGAESNRSKRLCRPLHNLFATPPEDLLCVDYLISSGSAFDHLKKAASPLFCHKPVRLALRILERKKSLELSTSTLARLRSTN
jgi:hypothetical protein